MVPVSLYDEVTVEEAPEGIRIETDDPDVREALATYLQIHPDNGDENAPLWIGTRGALRHRSSVMRILTQYRVQVFYPGFSMES